MKANFCRPCCFMYRIAAGEIRLLFLFVQRLPSPKACKGTHSAVLWCHVLIHDGSWIISKANPHARGSQTRYTHRGSSQSDKTVFVYWEEMHRVCGVEVGGVRDAVWLAVVMWIRKQALSGNDVRARWVSSRKNEVMLLISSTAATLMSTHRTHILPPPCFSALDLVWHALQLQIQSCGPEAYCN